MKFFLRMILRLLFISLLWYCTLKSLTCKANQTVEDTVFSSFDYSDFYEDETEPEDPLPFTISFQPERLNFKDSPLCIASVAEFTIVNSGKFSVEILSISSTDSQFHPLFFRKEHLLPNTSFSVQAFFLPYFERTFKSSFLINNSLGEQLVYSVEGNGIPNPFRVKPFLHNRALAGSAFPFYPITLFNPYNEPLQILEVFTSESFLSLNEIEFNSTTSFLSTNQNASSLSSSSSSSALSSNLSSASLSRLTWVIEPFTSRAVISFTIVTKMLAGFYRGFIHIHTNKEKMIVPVEIELLSGGLSLYPSHLSPVENQLSNDYPVSPPGKMSLPVVDFGLFTRKNEKISVDLSFWNYGLDSVRVLSVTTLQHDSRLKIDLQSDFPMKSNSENLNVVPSALSSSALVSVDGPTKVAVLTFTAKTFDRIDGRLLITTNDSNPALAAFEVVYTGTLLQGRVTVNPANTTIFLSPSLLIPDSNDLMGLLSSSSKRSRKQDSAKRNVISRVLIFTNRYNMPVTIHSAIPASCSEFIRMNSSLLDHSVVDSFRSFPPLFVEIDISQFRGNNEKEAVFPKTCWLEVLTNVSSQRFPVHFITGQLRVELFEGGEGSTNEELVNDSLYEERWDYYLASLNYYFPRDLRMILSNDNPIPIPIKIRNTSSDVCVCREVAWAKGQYDIRRGIDFMKNSTALTYEVAKALTNKCVCYSPSSSGLRSSSRDQVDLVIKPGYNLLVSIHYRFNYSVNSLRTNIVPISSSSLASSSDSLHYQFHSHLVFTTSYQLIHLNFHHNFVFEEEGTSPFSIASPSSASTFFALLPSSRSSFVLGFDHSLNYAIPSSIMQNIESIKMKPFLSFLTMNLYSSQNIIQIQSTYLRCLHGGDSIYTNTYSEEEGGEDDFIFGFRLWVCLSTVLKELHYLKSPSSEMIDIFDYYDEFTKEANKFNSMSEVYFKFLQLQRLVFRYFPLGVELLPSSYSHTYASTVVNDKRKDDGNHVVSLILRTADALQYHHLDLRSIQLPMSILLSSYSLSYVVSSSFLSAFSVGGGAFFAIYIQVSNPFDFDLDFMLIDETDSLSKSNPKTLLLSESDKGCPGQDQFIELQEMNFSYSSVSDFAKLNRLSSSADLLNASSDHHNRYNYTRTLINSTAIIRSYHYHNVHYGKDDGSSSMNSDTDIPISSSCFPPPKPSTVSNLASESSRLSLRTKNVMWKVKAGKNGFIGPIDFSHLLQDDQASFSVSKTFYVGNSFTGYNAIQISINISEPELETRNFSVCRPKDFCSSLAPSTSSSHLFGFSPLFPISVNITSFEDVLAIDLFSKRSSLTVSDVIFNNNSCAEYETKLKGQQKRMRAGETASLCQQFPLRLQTGEPVAFRLPVVIDCSRRYSLVHVQFFEFPAFAPSSSLRSSNTALHEVQWILTYSDVVLAQCLHRNSSFLLCFLTLFLSFFLALSHLLLHSSVGFYFGTIRSPFAQREKQTYFSSFERESLSSQVIPSSSIVYQEIDLEDIELHRNVTVDQLLETMAETGVYKVPESNDNDAQNGKKVSQPQQFWRSPVVDDEESTASELEETVVKPPAAEMLSDDEEISHFNYTSSNTGKSEGRNHHHLTREQGWDIIVDENPPLDNVPACSQSPDLRNFSKPPSLVSSIGAPPGLGLAASSSATYHIENQIFSSPLRSPQCNNDGAPWWYRPSDPEKEYTLWNEFNPDNNLINYNHSATQFSRTPSDGNTDEVDDQNIFRLSENINELLDEEDEEQETSLHHPASSDIGNVDPWQQMNNPNNFFSLLSPRETEKKSNLFFGPGGFFDEIPSNLEGTLEERDSKGTH
jgi:hypothetical protein